MTLNMAKSTSIRRKPGAFEKRVHEIDFFRGLLIILVVVDHLMIQFYINNTFSSELQAAASWYYHLQIRFVIRFIALIGFCFISGISSAFSRNNWVRSGQLLLVWGLLAVVTSIFQFYKVFGDFHMFISFNIIGALAWSTLLYCFVQNKSWRSILVMVLVAFLISWYVVPWLQRINEIRGVTPWAPALFEPVHFTYGDWMPLFPFAMFFMLGALLSYFVYQPRKESVFPTRFEWERPFCFVGRHTMAIYFGHIMILVPIFFALNAIFGA